MELVKQVGWQPLHHTVATRRLTNLKKYLDGVRHIDDDVFVPEAEPLNRISSRLQAKKKQHGHQLKTQYDARNSKEDKLAAAHARRLWNALPAEVVSASVKAFGEMVKSEEVINELCMCGVISVLEV